MTTMWRGRKSALATGLLVGIAVAGAASGQQTIGQQTTATEQAPAITNLVAQVGAAPTAPQTAAAETAGGESLTEVVVTATRREETIQQVPMSVSAVTTQDIANEGIKTANDLVQMVPGLAISLGNGGGTGGQPGNPNIAIRGITSGVGASTTGIYLDDVPLQQRNAGTNAAVFPQLFDLERVEVLRGPQGTLYGGSSEGGTMRFITPAPSFTKNSMYDVAEASETEGGAPNEEVGVAVGGPLIDDTLAGHASVWYRHDGGWIDHVSQFTGDVLPNGHNTNSEDHDALHLELAWKPVGPTVVTFSYFYLSNFYRDTDEYYASIPQYQALLGPAPGKLYTFCPCNFGPNTSGSNTNIGKNFYTSDSQLQPQLDPHSNSMSIPSVTIDVPFQPVDVKLISARTDTINDAFPNYENVATASRSVTPLEEPYNALPNNGPYIATLPVYFAAYLWHAETTNLTEELRVASSNPDSFLTWVGGLFYEVTRESSIESENADVGNLGAAVQLGLPSATGTPFAADNGIALIEPQTLHEVQEAAYGQLTLNLTKQLHAIVGVRVTRDDFSFAEAEGGSVFGYPPGVVEPIANGSVTQNPVTPLYGLQYRPNSDLNLYATASKGFRPGGVNQLIPASCDASLAQIGYSTNNVPQTYHSDSLWSYELGAKAVTWGGKASIDGSAYRIDWTGIETSVGLTCGLGIIVNGARAVSRGADVQAAAELFPGFIGRLSTSYTDARYSGAVSNGASTLISSGAQLPGIPAWSGTASVEYHFQLANRPTFLRLDYTYEGASVASASGPGTPSYIPEAFNLPSNRIANARAGMRFGSFDVDAFVANLTNSEDTLNISDFASGPGPVGCKNAACTLYQENAVGAILSTFRPRTYGIDVSFRY